MPPGKNARADASDGIFSGISLPRPSAFWVQGDTPWSLRVGRESRGPREGESKHPPWPSGPCGAEREEVYGSSAAITHSLLRLADFCGAPFFSPLRHSAKRCDTSPAGGGKCTCVNLCKVCGKAKLKKVRLTTKFSSAHGRELGSLSGRAGAKRLRGEQNALPRLWRETD